MPKYTDKEIEEIAFATFQQSWLQEKDHRNKGAEHLIRIIKILDICIPIVLVLLVVFGVIHIGGGFDDSSSVSGRYFLGGL